MSTPTIIQKSQPAAEVNLSPGEASFVAWITLDAVDNEADVVIAAGVDWKSVFMGVPGDPAHPGNPVVLAGHDVAKWPLGRCEWIKLAKPGGRSTFSGLYAKTLVDEDPEALRVFGMIQRRMLRGISIRFRPPDDFRPGEWGPPTAEELRQRPDWKTARRIIRRCVLLEYSICSLGMNQAAVIEAVSKGMELPSFLKTTLTTEAPTMADQHQEPGAPGHDDTPFAPGDHVRHMPSGACGEFKAMHDGGEVPDDVEDERGDGDEAKAAPAALVDLHDDDHKPTGVVKCYGMKDLADGDGPGVVDVPEAQQGASEKALAESSGTAGGYAAKPEVETKDDGDMDDMTEGMPPPIRKGDRVSFAKGATHPAGVGIVKSIHRSGMVPGCVNEAEASEDAPHARVKMYKSMDHPFHFHESDDHAAVPVAKLARLDTMRFEPASAKHAAKAMVYGDDGQPFLMEDRAPVSKGVAPYKESPVASGAWNAANARLSLKRYAESGKGADGNTTYNMRRYAAGFAYCDDSKPEDFGSYKLPIKDVRNGKLVVVKEAVAAALAAVDGGRGGVDVPESDRAALKALLERYRKLWAEDEAEKSLPAPASLKTRAEWEAEVALQLATSPRYSDTEARVARITQEAEDRLYGVIR